MDRSRQLHHLAEAQAHVARGEHHIFEQELRIVDLEVAGWDSRLARSLLQNFYLAQAQYIAHRNQILKELGK